MTNKLFNFTSIEDKIIYNISIKYADDTNISENVDNMKWYHTKELINQEWQTN